MVQRDTVTGDVLPLRVDLEDAEGEGSSSFTGMVGVGMHHIAEGTDHRLFLLTLLLPAPLRAVAGRWRGAVSTKTALRRILAITLAFTLGHSVTLAAGSLGLPVPIGTVEALIALSILIAVARAVRPLSPPSPRSAGCWTGSGPPPRSQSSPTASACCRSPWSSACGWPR